MARKMAAIPPSSYLNSMTNFSDSKWRGFNESTDESAGFVIRNCCGLPGIIFFDMPDLNNYFLNCSACDIIWPKSELFVANTGYSLNNATALA